MVDHAAVQLALRTQALALVVCTTPTGGFARAGTATYTDSTGALATAASNVPRVAHYVNGTLQAPLLESAGANIAPYSERADLWGSQGGCQVTANTTTAPDGTVTGDTLMRASGVAAVAGPASAFTGNGTKHLSLFVKQGTSAKSTISIWDDTANAWLAAVAVTWSSGAPVVTAAYGTSPTIATSEAMTGGWYRIGFTIPGVVATNVVYVNVSPTDDEGGTGVDGDSLIVWGLQLEDSATMTSYIPNATSGTASRAADVGSADALIVATTTGYQRFAGSFVTDGFAVGMEVVPTGFTQTTPGIVTAVSALTLTIRGGRTAERPAGTTYVSVGLPAIRAWTNVDTVPVAGRWYVEEDYLPGPAAQVALGPLGEMEVLPTYVLKLYSPTGVGITAVTKLVTALLTLFAPRTGLALTGGGMVQVRGAPAPYASQLLPVGDTGWAVCAITIPCRVRSANSI